ncbi:MAG: MICOS complex subunit MIC60, partial [Pseudomonadota bacterium]|nr:MICOS complex subunit MIC60 [Pseudomonadota bacterium]
SQGALIAEFQRLGPMLRGMAPDENWWTGVRREMGSLVSIRRNDTPSPRPAARYDRALARLEAGEIDAALAEAMRLPGASRPEAQGWIGRARRLIAAKRALDEIESAALVGPARPAPIPLGA